MIDERGKVNYPIAAVSKMIFRNNIHCPIVCKKERFIE